MSARAGLDRYRHIGRIYDLISMERLLYRKPRRRLLAMVGPIPAATVVDVGCGTGLNFAGLRELVGPTGCVVGIDASPSMLAAAQRRVQRAGWSNVTTVRGDIHELGPALRRVDVREEDIDVLVATFVISTIQADARFWNTVDNLCRHRQRLVAVADLGQPSSIGRFSGLALRSLAALGGSHSTCEPWKDLAARSSDVITESHLGGHVHLAAGHCPPERAP